MTLTEVIASIISALCMVITAVLAWVSIYRVNRVNVSFSGEPVDKKDFEKALNENASVHAQIFSKIGGVERGASQSIKDYEAAATESRRKMHDEISAIDRKVSRLEATSELNTATLIRVEGKFDRVLERDNA